MPATVFVAKRGFRDTDQPLPRPAAATLAPVWRCRAVIKARLPASPRRRWPDQRGARCQYGDGADDQAREIIAAQIAPPVAPLVSAVPPGTTLRAVFITKSGDAYVDLSREARSAHPGGTLNELLTVYTIVNALTANLPAVTAVQLLIDGKEVDTLSGHVDLRRPLVKNLAWVQ